ncbi:uncharacterized protein LOC125479455 [Pyrus x bretschneideri]|uniref:uncharacterized protein LOC125479455 n=1 Tax=Pyrus x bretschneideri TaxID=225117 RepID=UPI00202FB5F4|nr:uncharacterized protein LOC125479455 [Pyrus x bretschneideri]
MADQGEHESSKAQVPLVAPAKHDGEQHRMNHVQRNRGIDEQYILKSNMDWQVTIYRHALNALPKCHDSLRQNDVLICRIFATTLQNEAQYWFYTLPPCLIRNFSKLFLVFTKEYSSYRSIKKKFDHLFNMKNDLNESLRTCVKRFKVEKVKIVECKDSIACSTFRKGFLADHPFFRKLIMGKNLTLVDFYALAEKHSLWDEAKCSQKPLEQPRKYAELTQKKARDKPLNNKDKPGSRCRDRSFAKESSVPKTYTKFSVLINQIIRDLKDKPWFKMLLSIRGDTTKMDETKYCAFHKGPEHTTNDYTI